MIKISELWFSHSDTSGSVCVEFDKQVKKEKHIVDFIIQNKEVLFTSVIACSYNTEVANELKQKIKNFFAFEYNYNELRDCIAVYGEFGVDDTTLKHFVLENIKEIIYTDKPIAADKIDWGLYCNDDNKYNHKLAKKYLSAKFNKVQEAILSVDKEDKQALYNYIEEKEKHISILSKIDEEPGESIKPG